VGVGLNVWRLEVGKWEEGGRQGLEAEEKSADVEVGVRRGEGRKRTVLERHDGG